MLAPGAEPPEAPRMGGAPAVRRASLVGQQGPEDEVDDELWSGQQAGEQEEEAHHAGRESETAAESGTDPGDPTVVAGAGEAAGHDLLLHVLWSCLDGRGAT